MVKGLFFDESGEVQQIGPISNWAAIVQAVENSLPRLHELHKSTLPAQELSEDELERLLIEKRKAKELQKEEK